MKVKYGVISDVHEDPRIVIQALQKLKDQGIDKLIVNGDIGGNYGSLEKSQQYTAFILDQIAKSEVESYVQPGSHETLLGYGVVIEHFSNKHSNIHDTTKLSKISSEGHDLVFLPGSDFLCGGEYQIGSGEIPSGKYFDSGHNLVEFNNFDQYVEAIKKGMARRGMQYFDMDDLKDQVTDPAKTMVVCHVPRKFDNLENCVDMAHFYEARTYRKDKSSGIWKHEVNFVFPYPNNTRDHRPRYGLFDSDEDILQDIVEKDENSVHPMGYEEVAVERKENRGNEDLRKIYEGLGITKAISAHFHESSHRANDSNGNHVPEDTFVNELFWNSGHLDRGFFGILEVDENKVRYKNLNL